MFNRNNQTTDTMANPEPLVKSNGNSKNVLHKDVKIKGTLEFDQEFELDGFIDGEVKSKSGLIIGKNATIKGLVQTQSVTLFGKVYGDIIVEDKCILKASSVLEGDVTSARISIEEGANFCGKSTVRTANNSSKPAASQNAGKGNKDE